MSENQVAPEPVTNEPQGHVEHNPTYNPENQNQGCWTAECMDLPKPTGQRTYCPQCQFGVRMHFFV